MAASNVEVYQFVVLLVVVLCHLESGETASLKSSFTLKKAHIKGRKLSVRVCTQYIYLSTVYQQIEPRS